MAICDQHCFECIYPDCIWDGDIEHRAQQNRLGDRIKAARAKVGLNQRQLAEKLGVRQALLSLWETNTSGVSKKNMEKLIKEFPELA